MMSGSGFNPSYLQQAKDNLISEGDTDIFPKPFEIAAIASEWDLIERELMKLPVGSYNWVGGRRVIVPKSRFTFRVATQLDPIDALVLTALIFEYGSKMESERISTDENMVFSYRFSPDGGLLYDATTDWYRRFWSESLKNAGKNNYVIMTDVTDYYNQISHHTVENQLSRAGLPNDVVKSIIKMLKNLTQNVSRGIPVGPHAMHLIAELAFDPIDRTLKSLGYQHCRFVDDIHIFCKSEDEAEIALYDLATILDKQQRLVLQRYKTKIINSSDFIMHAQRIIDNKPINDTEKEILDFMDSHSHGDPYRSISTASLSHDELRLLDKFDFESLLEIYLEEDDPNFPRIRWFYRRLAQIGVPDAVLFSVRNLNRLTPAIGDLAKYLTSAETNLELKWIEIGTDLVDSLNAIPIIHHSDYLQMALLNLFSKISDLNHVDDLLQRYDASSNIMKRKIIKAATKADAGYWLRGKKEEIISADNWLRRALIIGASTFQKDERNFWLKQFKGGDNLLEKAVAEWVIKGNTI